MPGRDDGTPAVLLSGLPRRKSRAVFLAGKLWIVTGGGFYSYDGTEAKRVSASGAYVPTTTISRSPSGGGVSYEAVNLLTPYRKNAFQTDGKSVKFTLDGEIDVSGAVRAWVWGEEVTDFTLDRAAGTDHASLCSHRAGRGRVRRARRAVSAHGGGLC